MGTTLIGVALGGQLSGEAEPKLASRFVRADAESAVRAACASPAPFVVLDTFAHFRPANIDDELFDAAEGRPGEILHGDIVAAIVESTHPGAVAYQTNPIFNVWTLAQDFKRLADDIASSKIAKPAAIVSSIVVPIDIKRIDPGLTEGALTERRKDVLRMVSGGFDPKNPYTEIDRQIGRLREAGVPVFVAAGNTAPDQTLNVLALSDGVFAVGAIGRDAAPAPYTSTPGLVSVWSPGYVVLTSAPGGLSISRGHAVELKGADLPERREVLSTYVGERAEEIALQTPEALAYVRGPGASRQRNRYLAMNLALGIYRTADLMSAYGYPVKSGTFARAVAEGPYMHFPSDTIFKIDSEGRLRFDPIGDGSKGQLQVADATSFAAPNICAAGLFPERVASGGE